VIVIPPRNAHDFCILMEAIWDGPLSADHYTQWHNAIKVASLCAGMGDAITNHMGERVYPFTFPDGSRANVGEGSVELLDKEGKPLPSEHYGG